MSVDLSIVIPTRDRRERLLTTLAALDRQRTGGAAVEVVVVDNGSADGTLEALQERSGVLPLQALSEPRSGASHARNRAIEAAQGEVALLLGDDMEPAGDDLLASHLALHRDGGAPRAVLGRAEWAPPVTPFMRWLDDAGMQFSFGMLEAGPVDPGSYFYSSHASLPTRLLRDLGGFDEDFPFLVEDTELGIRMRRRGVVLEYHPELVVSHHHPQELGGFERRMEVVGAAARRLRERYPEDAPAAMAAPSPKWWLFGPAALAGRLLLRLGVAGRLRERSWTAIVLAAYTRGWRAGEAG